MESVKVWVEAGDSGTKSALPSLARAAVGKTVELSTEALQEGIKTFSVPFADLLDGQAIGLGHAVIDEIELSLTITASGGIELLGKATLGTQAAIKVKLKRKS
ncbi:hypothetical protein SOM61_22745 [Massilia sp. CFBP9012]|uniref:Pepco domain-containing protein n=1 Tax=Massilia sp. CFBP9012 TaxID=3096531 RepID=UPI002A6A49EC|nr:hypothetical protein [Massilia sp. CFBP9012]MDY0977786.1 hypothetical protein [Massilia sp. CFBP9012]